MKFKAPEEPISYEMPDEAARDEDKSESWYVQNVRHYATYYNQESTFAGNISRQGSENASSSSPTLPVADYIRSNFAYYFGRQDNVDYNYLTQDRTGNSFQNPWIKGKQAAKLIDFLKGPALSLLDEVSFSAKTIDPDELNDKQELFDKIDIKKNFMAEWKMLESLGVKFNPINDEFELPEEYDDWKKDFQSAGEELAVAFADEIYEQNKAKYILINALLHTVVGGIGSVYVYVENGRAKLRHIASQNRIFDHRNDDDFGGGARFSGFVERLTPGQCISRWKDQLTEEDVENIKSLAKGDGDTEAFCNYYNMGVSNYTPISGKGASCMVHAVTMFWIGPRDFRLMKSKNRYGDTRVKKADEQNPVDSERKSDLQTDVLHCGTLIANRWLVDWGYMNNVVRDYNNKGNPILPIHTYIPNMCFGEPRPVMGMLRNNQDEIDRLKHKIRELNAKDQGKVLVFRVPIGEGVSHLKVADDLKDVGITVLPYNPDLPEEVRGIKPFEMVDLSNSGSIQELLALINVEQVTMEEVLNLSKMALGQTNTYVSNKAQQNSVSYSSMGTAYLYNGFSHFVNNIFLHAANMQKMISPTDKWILFNTSSAGQKFLKMTKKDRFEDVCIFIKANDTVDDKGRERLSEFVKMFATNPNGGIDFEDILMIEQEKTWSGMIRKLRYSMKKKKRDAKQQQDYQNAVQQAMNQQNIDGQMQQEQMRQKGADNRMDQQIEHKSFDSVLKHNAATQQPVEQPI